MAKLTKTYKEFVEEYRLTTEKSTSDFVKSELPYIKAFFPYVWLKAKEQTGRFRKHFKDEWNRTDSKLGIFHKPFIVTKYCALLIAGIASCIPGYSSIVGFYASMITGIASANRNSMGVGKTVLSALYGAFIGSAVGILPVVGPGIACGITKGTIEALQDGWNKSKDISSSDNFLGKARIMLTNTWSMVTTLIKRVAKGVAEGVIPIIGPALVYSKLDRASIKISNPVIERSPIVAPDKVGEVDVKALAAQTPLHGVSHASKGSPNLKPGSKPSVQGSIKQK